MRKTKAMKGIWKENYTFTGTKKTTSN